MPSGTECASLSNGKLRAWWSAHPLMMFADYGECFFMGKINEFENVKRSKKEKKNLSYLDIQHPVKSFKSRLNPLGTLILR